MIKANKQNPDGTDSQFAVFVPCKTTAGAVDYLLSGDCAMTSCTGYWARWVAFDVDVWLIVESEGKLDSGFAEMLRGMHGRGEPLPSHVHLFDRTTATEAFREGVARWGVEWWGDGKHDSHRDDLVLQLALLGEERYG